MCVVLIQATNPDAVDRLPLLEDLPVCKATCEETPASVLGLRRTWDEKAS